MKKFKYLPSEIAKINQIFSDNNIKLMFESFSDYYKSLEQLIKEISKFSIRYHLENYYSSYSHEYDVKKQKLLTISKYYLYSAVVFHTNKKINLHLNSLREGFFYFQNGLFDIDNSFGIACRENTNIVEGFYYKLTNGNIPVLTREFFNLFLSNFNLESSSILFLENLRYKNYDYLEFNYIAFDFSDNISKLGFATPIFNFIDSDFLNFYSDYIHASNFVECLKQLDQNLGVGIQLSTNLSEPKFISLELKVPSENKDEYLSIMKGHNLISDKDVDYINFIIQKEQVVEHTVKFRWTDQNKFTVKWYNEFPNALKAPSWYDEA